MAQKKPGRKKEPTPKRGLAWPRRTGFRGMTVRDWLQLLIVPLALVVISFLFTMQQDARQQAKEDQRAEAERELAEQRAQDEALQAYLDQMSNLLLEKDLRASEGDSEVRTLARSRTLTALGRLDPRRKAQVMNFLIEANLVQSGVDGKAPVIELNGADLSGVRDLSGEYVKVAGTDIISFGPDLSGANLKDAWLGFATLDDADLSDADLSKANLGGTSLEGADLGAANLTGVLQWYEDQLTAANSLKDATMPDGQKYEDWSKDKGRQRSGGIPRL